MSSIQVAIGVIIASLIALYVSVDRQLDRRRETRLQAQNRLKHIYWAGTRSTGHEKVGDGVE